MPITEHQREQRNKHLGSSDMAAVLGLDRYRTPHDVYLEKTDKLRDNDISGKMAVYLGNHLEDGVLAFASDELGELRRNQYRSHPDLPIGASLDAILVDSDEPVEAKTSGLLGPTNDEWGPDGTDQVPDRVIIQVHTQMLCVEPTIVETAHVAALIGRRGFAMFHIKRSPRICEVIAETADRFWSLYVTADTPPPDSVASMDVLKLIKREPKSIATVESETVLAWVEAKEVLKEAKAKKEEAEAILLTALGTAEAGVTSEIGAVTYYERSRKGYTVESTTFRVLRHRKTGL